MNTDIRIAVSFKTHRKRKRLRMLLGPGSTDYLIDLWIATAMNHPTGVLSGMDDIDIALEAGWEDDPHRFVAALKESGFLDTVDGTCVLHDWAEHQAYVVKAPERKASARHAAGKRWAEKRGAGVYPDTYPGAYPDTYPGAYPGAFPSALPDACGEHAGGTPGAMRDGKAGNAPLPSPLPSPVPEKDSSLRSESSCPGPPEPGGPDGPCKPGSEEPKPKRGPGLRPGVKSGSKPGAKPGSQPGAKPGSRSGSKPDMPEDSEAYRLAVFMRDELKRALPTFRTPDIRRWAREFDVALRNDERMGDARFVARVIRWVANDEFWRCNCQSPGKLRKQFDQLTAKMEFEAAKARGGHGGSPAQRRLEANREAMQTFIDGAPV